MGSRVVGLVLLICAGAVPARAYFESSEVGVRALSLGSNFVSVSDDASALYWNPAGIVRVSRHQALFTYEHSPELEGVRRGFAAVVLHTSPLSVGVGWHAVSLEDALREDLLYVSVSRLLVRRALGAFVSGGATFKVAHVGVDTDGLGSVAGLRSGQTRLTADVGVLLSPIPNVTFGAIVRNLGRPQFDLLEGGTQTTLEDELEWGVSLRWRPNAQLHFSRVKHPRREAESKLGAELEVARRLSLRLGLGRDVVSGGVGVRGRGWEIESSFQAHEVLGLVSRVGLRLGFGSARRGVGGDFDEF
ncbi:MAG: hypothetical protein ACE5G2_12105 [Candidatus Krumholzibacteriia bacterium]